VADDPFDLLIKLRDAAETLNANAQQLIQRYRRKPVFSSNSRSPGIARAQQRASARNRLLCESSHIKHIRKAVEVFGDAGYAKGAASLVQRAVGLKCPPIYVGDNSYPTAHEAAEALGRVVMGNWDDAGGQDALERAPDRLHAEFDGEDADIAIEVSLDVWRRLRSLRKRLPADLWGQIQQEFQETWTLLESEEPGDETESGRSVSRVSRQEADAVLQERDTNDPTLKNGTAGQTNRVFISYAHSSPEHKQTVFALVETLREHSLTVAADTDVKTPQGPEEGWPKWMKRQIKEADWVLMFFDQLYRRRFDGEEEPDTGLGATWEGAIITHHFYRNSTKNKKFIPLLADGASTDLIPDELFAYTRYFIPKQAIQLAAALRQVAPNL